MFAAAILLHGWWGGSHAVWLGAAVLVLLAVGNFKGWRASMAVSVIIGFLLLGGMAYRWATLGAVPMLSALFLPAIVMCGNALALWERLPRRPATD